MQVVIDEAKVGEITIGHFILVLFFLIIMFNMKHKNEVGSNIYYPSMIRSCEFARKELTRMALN